MKAKRFLTSGMITAFLLVFMTGLAIAQAPDATPLGTGFTYQGQLKSNSTSYTGTCDFQFGLYDAATMGSAVGELTVTNVAVTEGFFTSQLDFGSGKFTGDNRWLDIWVRCPAGSGTYQQLSPRQPLTAAPYALHALDAWSRTGNAGTLPGTNFLGTTDDRGLVIKVNNQRAFLFQPNNTSPNLIGGHSGNLITSGVFGATISGGGQSTGANLVTDSGGTIGGGYGNQAGNNAGTTTDATNSTVGGGEFNIASGYLSAVSGGSSNIASGSGATIGGGAENIASTDDATIGGGYANQANGNMATVSGGFGNTASGANAIVGGGYSNEASANESIVGGGDNNTASGIDSAINGGFHNSASGIYSTISGGNYNIASGLSSTVAGGSNNVASGDYSFAAGSNANAIHKGSFVWADHQGSNIWSGDTNTFTVRAQNGANIYASTVSYPGAYVHNSINGSVVGQGSGIVGRSSSNYGIGTVGWNSLGGVGVGAWSYGGRLIEAYAGDFPGGTLRFYVDQAGNVHFDGTAMPYAEIPSPTGETPSYVSLYGISAAEAWYEDLGSESLISGKVIVTIDPLFAKTVSLIDEYQVQVTATCNEPVLLFVSEKTDKSFTVQGVSLDGKPSNCGFDYRISAKPLGMEALRLEAVEIPEPVIVEREQP